MDQTQADEGLQTAVSWTMERLLMLEEAHRRYQDTINSNASGDRQKRQNDEEAPKSLKKQRVAE
jgi:hypothetical protein